MKNVIQSIGTRVDQDQIERRISETEDRKFEITQFKEEKKKSKESLHDLKTTIKKINIQTIGVLGGRRRQKVYLKKYGRKLPKPEKRPEYPSSESEITLLFQSKTTFFKTQYNKTAKNQRKRDNSKGSKRKKNGKILSRDLIGQERMG